MVVVLGHASSFRCDYSTDFLEELVFEPLGEMAMVGLLPASEGLNESVEAPFLALCVLGEVQIPHLFFVLWMCSFAVVLGVIEPISLVKLVERTQELLFL